MYVVGLFINFHVCLYVLLGQSSFRDRSKTNIRQKETKFLVCVEGSKGHLVLFFKFDASEKQSNLNVDLQVRQLENPSEKSGILVVFHS
jgi:hypothetical protein